MKRNALIRMIIVLSVLLALLCGTTFALMFRQTQLLDNQFDAAFVDCVVEESFNDSQKSSITVKNTGNTDAFLRLRLVTYWIDSNGNIVSKPSRTLKVSLADGWVAGSDNTYYYAHPVAPQAFTPNLLKENLTLVEEDGYFQVVEVFADAIQSKPDRAVTGSWGVTLEEGAIIAAP